MTWLRDKIRRMYDTTYNGRFNYYNLEINAQ